MSRDDRWIDSALQLLAREFSFTDPFSGQPHRFVSRRQLQSVVAAAEAVAAEAAAARLAQGAGRAGRGQAGPGLAPG